MATGVAEVIRIMGGERVLGRRVRTTGDLRHAVEHGLPLEALARVILHVAGASDATLRYRIVPKATLHRRKGRLSPEESERLERLARISALAGHVWEDDAKAREFLMHEQPMLGNERPVDLARTDLGARQVEELLWQMEYSLPV